MEITSLVCDCGCGETATFPKFRTNWFSLVQMKKFQVNRPSEPKLKQELHFSSLECLKKWTSKAVKVIPGLQQAADRLSPRGDMSQEDIAGLYI